MLKLETYLNKDNCFVKFRIKGAVCRIELGIAVKIQNIGEGFFHQPSSSDLTHAQDARLTTPTGTSAHDDE